MYATMLLVIKNSFFYNSLFFLASLIFNYMAHAEAPLFRLKAGASTLALSGSPTVSGQSLNSMITFQPSVLWQIPEFSSRLGFHYLQELGGPFGLTTLSGIGMSGYYYFRGVSTTYSNPDDTTIVQKYIPGPYLFGSLSPINFNVNIPSSSQNSQEFFASAFLYDLSTGVGYDYLLSSNMILSAEFSLRNGTGSGSTNPGGSGAQESLGYQGFSILFSFATSYY